MYIYICVYVEHFGGEIEEEEEERILVYCIY